MSEPTSDITLRCEHCGHQQRYARSADPDLPPEVALIVTSGCDKCEHDNGGFGSETWFDPAGKEVSQT